MCREGDFKVRSGPPSVSMNHHILQLENDELFVSQATLDEVLIVILSFMFSCVDRQGIVGLDRLAFGCLGTFPPL